MLPQMKTNLSHAFMADDAEEFGVEEAILLNSIRFWIRLNFENSKHFHEGRTWMFNSAAAFTATHRYWTKHQIRRLLSSLVNQGALLMDQRGGTDRSGWYALKTDDPNMDAREPSRPRANSAPCSTDTNTDSKSSLRAKRADEVPLPDNLQADDHFKAAWKVWLEDRAARKKTVTGHAAKLQLAKLSKWGAPKATEAIETAIEKGWTGLFEPETKEPNERTSGQSNRRQRVDFNKGTFNEGKAHLYSAKARGTDRPV